jgi:hypothetical protein
MKTLLLSAALSTCPALKGAYHCMISPTEYSLLVVDQVEVSADLSEYSFFYKAIGGDPEVIRASTTGETDDFGWITKCADKKLISVSYDGAYLSELFLDKDHNLIRRQNGVEQQRCPKKKN